MDYHIPKGPPAEPEPVLVQDLEPLVAVLRDIRDELRELNRTNRAASSLVDVVHAIREIGVT